MKKLFLLASLACLVWFCGLAVSPRGWCLAVKHESGLSHIYTDLQHDRFSRHYAFILLGYDSIKGRLFFLESV